MANQNSLKSVFLGARIVMVVLSALMAVLWVGGLFASQQGNVISLDADFIQEISILDDETAGDLNPLVQDVLDEIRSIQVDDPILSDQEIAFNVGQEKVWLISSIALHAISILLILLPLAFERFFANQDAKRLFTPRAGRWLYVASAILAVIALCNLLWGVSETGFIVVEGSASGLPIIMGSLAFHAQQFVPALLAAIAFAITARLMRHGADVETENQMTV